MAQVFQRLISFIRSSVFQCSHQTFYRWEDKATATNYSPTELLCYIANIPCSACLSIENKENRDQNWQKPVDRIIYNQRGVAHAPANNWHDACALYSLPERACARSTARWLFRLFSRHISGTQSFQENRHININLLVVHNPLVPLIGRLVACSARTRADRQTNRSSTITLAANARRGLISVWITKRKHKMKLSTQDNTCHNGKLRYR